MDSPKDLISTASISVPVNANDGTLRAGFSSSSSSIVEDTFRDVGIRSETDTYSVGFRQPVIRTPSEEFALGLDFDYRRSQSFILEDIPFSFSVGPEDGFSKVSALRFSQDWTHRGASRVLAARSQFNLGLDIFDATNNETGPDGQFFSWIGQFQWVEQVSSGILSLIKLNAQLTTDSLLPLERFSLGGVGTIRGYPQNQLVSDNAINASAELRIPLTRNPNVLQVTSFLETGVGWNNSVTMTQITSYSGRALAYAGKQHRVCFCEQTMAFHSQRLAIAATPCKTMALLLRDLSARIGVWSAYCDSTSLCLEIALSPLFVL